MDHAELIASRLCHDLVSPLGAIGNGIELLRLSLPESEELAMLEQATAAAQARVLLYRLAFGAADPDQMVSEQDLRAALAALATNRPIAVHVETGPLPRPRARALALAALCAESAMAWGGQLTLTAQGLHATAPRLQNDPALWDALSTGTPPPARAATVHFALLARTGVTRAQVDVTSLSLTL